MKAFIRGIAVAVLAILAMPQMRGGAESWTVPGSTPSQVFARGNGSAADPYIIHTAQQLANFAYMVYWCYDYYEGKYIVLDNDIVLNDNVMVNPSGARPWMPIGSEGSFKDGKFLGTFDGQGHTIYGLYIDHTSTISGYAGLFGTVKGDGVVRNVNVNDAVIDLRQFTRHNLYVGGIVGYTTDNARVEGCSFQGYIYSVDYSKYQGGIVGYHNSYKDITNCHVEGFVGCKAIGDLTTTWTDYVGGIAGYSYASIINCTAVANVVGGTLNGDNYVGGIVGYCKQNVANCITYDKDANGNSITINGKANRYTGGVAGYANLVSHCRNYAEVSCLSDGMDLGGVAGQAGTVEYSANFGRIYSTVNPLDIDIVSMGGIAGLVDYARNCVNYGIVDIPTMFVAEEHGSSTDYAHCGGIAGICYNSMANCLNLGKLTDAILYHQSVPSYIAYGLCGSNRVTPQTSYYLDSTTERTATPSGNGSMKTTLEYLQSVDYLNSCTASWGMAWGLDMTTKYPLPILWGGVDRDFALSVVDGDGSEANPYIISSVESFRAMNSQLYNNSSNGLKGKYFKQVADLDFAGEEFMPLGLYYRSEYDMYVSYKFQGHYDGGGHTVRNITFDCDASQNVGFIAQMTGEGTLKNLNFSNVNFNVKGGNVGIALGAYTTTDATARTPLSGVNVLACNIEANGDAIVGGIAGIVATKDVTSVSAPILTIAGCTIHQSSIDASNRAGGLAGAVANVAISHSTAACNLKLNNSYYTSEHYAGGLVGTVGFSDTRSYPSKNYYSAVFQADYCAILPTVDFDSATDIAAYDNCCFFGGVSGYADNGTNRLEISHSFVDFACFTDEMHYVCSGYVIGTASSAKYKFNYVEFPEYGHYSFGGGSTDIIEDGSIYTTFAALGGWDAYYLNGNSNKGDMKWGYYYPTATPNPYAVTSANGKYANFSSHYASQIIAPEKLYVDFTLPAVPLDNNVLTAAEGTSISQILVAAKANLVSHNGVASRLYLHDKMDFKYAGSFQTYAVHFAVENGAKCQVMCLPFEVRQEMLPKGSLMLAIDGYTASAVTSKVIDTAAAGMPFILYNANGVVIDDDSYDGIVTGATTADAYLSGTFAASTAAAGDYVLSADGSKFVRITDPDQPIDAFRGYVPAAKFPGAGDEVPFIIEADKFADLTTAGAVYKLNFPLYGVLVHNGVLYATTAKQSADISKPIEGLPMQEFESLYWYDNDQFDWIAIPGLGENYVGKAISTGFVAQYTGNQLAGAANYSIAGAAPSINLSTYTSAHILHGNYTNYADDDYHGFFVAPKTNEVARFYGYVTTEIDGVRYLTLEKEWCGLLNGKGVVIEGNSETMPDRIDGYQAFEGILVADAAANGGRKILFTEYKGEVTSTLDPATATDRIYSVDGAVVIEAATDGLATIYTPAGVMVAQQPVTAGQPAVIPLPAGLYIATLPTTATRILIR